MALLTDRRYEIDPTPNTARFMLNMPARADRLGRGRLRLVRPDRPEFAAAGDRARFGRRHDRNCVATGRGRHGVDHRPEPRAWATQSGQLPRRSGAARCRAGPRRGRAPDRSAAAPLGRGCRRGDHRAVRGPAPQRGGQPDPRQGLLAVGLHAALLRRRRSAARGRLHRARCPYEDVLVPEWAAGFCAFGCACADFEYRFDRQTDLPLLPDTPATTLAARWPAAPERCLGALDDQVAAEFEKSGYGHRRDRVRSRSAFGCSTSAS